jgi:nitrogen fixation protein NifX
MWINDKIQNCIMKIAFTSSDGIMVDTHFTKAEKFYIYEMKRGAVYFKGTRKTYSISDPEDNHSTDDEKLLKIYKTISDCRMLVTVSIGETQMKVLEKKGIAIDLVKGSINSVFFKLLKIYIR